MRVSLVMKVNLFFIVDLKLLLILCYCCKLHRSFITTVTPKSQTTDADATAIQSNETLDTIVTMLLEFSVTNEITTTTTEIHTVSNTHTTGNSWQIAMPSSSSPATPSTYSQGRKEYTIEEDDFIYNSIVEKYERGDAFVPREFWKELSNYFNGQRSPISLRNRFYRHINKDKPYIRTE
jgi:hypothetical protein